MAELRPSLLYNVQEFGDFALEGGADVPRAGPFYLAMVDEDETTFGPQHHRMDEYVYSATRTLSEGDPPKLELEIENPRIGLLDTSQRKQWCWFAWHNGTSIVPLFFGRIQGIPSDIHGETITVVFIAKPKKYIKKRQKVVEALRIPPFRDDLFVDVTQRDDPTSILESVSKLICIDPVTHVVSASDVLDAEDGNVDFTEDDHFYDGMNINLGTTPKSVVHVDATVNWTQSARGYLDLQTPTIVSYSGDGVISEWPKPLSQIAAGLTVFTSDAYDMAGIDHIVTISGSWQWQNREQEHNDGDTLSTNISWSVPSGGNLGLGGVSKIPGEVVNYKYQTGILDPYAVDGDGDPKPTNIPPSAQIQTAFAAQYQVATTLVLDYQAARPHTERIIFNLFADVQSVLADPAVNESGESIIITGADASVPLVDLLNWSTVSETYVPVGTIIFPDDPSLPGGKSIQRAVHAGTAGEDEPEFSDVFGEETSDGTDGLSWASLGPSNDPGSAPDWTGVSNVPAGMMILPRRPIFTTMQAYTAAARSHFPPANTSFSEGTLLQNNDGTFTVITQSGAGGRHGGLGTAAGATINSVPDGTSFFVALNSGTTGDRYVIPPFGDALNVGDTVVDNDITWQKVGTGVIPAGGTMGNVTAYTYFGGDRGREVSLPHLICRARALLRYSSRCVTTTFDCSYLKGSTLTLRNSVTLHDPRIPGGLILGKVTGTELIASDGQFICKVTMMSAAGKETTVTTEPGDPTYVEDGYVQDGYQQRERDVVLVPVVSDVAFTPITPIMDEDGITFPLTKEMIVLSMNIVGDGGSSAVKSAIDSMRKSAQLAAQPSSVKVEQQKIEEGANSLSQLLQEDPTYLDLTMKPLNGRGSFNRAYHVKCSTLYLPRQADLEASSTI